MRASEERHQGEKMSINPHLWWKLKTVRVQAAKQAIFLMVLFTGMAIASKAQSVALSLDSATGAAGQSITLNLSLADAAGAQPASLQWTMTYPSADISSISVTASSALASAGKTISCSSTGSSTTCVASGLNFGIISTGTIAGLTVHLASAPSHSSVPIQFTGDFAATADGSTIPVSATNGTITIAQAAPQLSGFSCNPTTLGSGMVSSCTITLTRAAVSTTTISLASSNSLLRIPASVSIASGSTALTFSATAASISASGTAVITATASGVSKSASIALVPPASVQLSSLSCTPTTLAPNSSSSCKISLTGSASAALSVALTSGNTVVKVPASVSVAKGSNSATFTASAGSFSANQTALVSAAASGRSVSTTLTLAVSVAVPVSIWTPATQPGTITDPDSNSVELGMRFRSDVAGSVTAVRFYKGAQNTGTHIGHLWTTSGALLASATFTAETPSGWQQAKFSSAVGIQPNTTYIISYYAPKGHYSSNEGFFSKTVNSPPLHALQDGTSGPDGVFRYGSSGFPNQSWHSSNYWVDLVFVPAGGTK